MFDGQKLGEDISGFVRNFMERELAPLKAENESLKARVAALEAMPAPEKGEPGEKGADGVTPEPEAIAEAFAPLAEQIITAKVAKAVAELPPAEPGPAGEKGDAGVDGKDGADGCGVKDMLIDRDDCLIATMEDGRVKNLGMIVGKNGTNGNDGAPGKDGRDGIELTSFDAIVLDDDRTVELKFVSGGDERVASFKWPVMLDRGVWNEERNYERGDVVTWGGSSWVAQQDELLGKPDTKDSGWRLATKRGRDGKDAK